MINADDRYAALWRELAAGKRQIEFGLEQPAAVTATYQLRPLESEIVVKLPKGIAAATVHAPGVHNVRNALAAAAAAVALEVPASAIAAGLERFSGIKGRLQKKRAINGALLIDDTYNANPESVRAAIDVLAKLPGRKLFVFGDMGELGSDAAALHAEVGICAKEAGIDQLLALGEHSARAAAAFGAGARHYPRIEELLADLENALGPTSRCSSKARASCRWKESSTPSSLTKKSAGFRSFSPFSSICGAGMLLDLAQWLAKDIRAFNVFSYITLRAVLACLTALVLSFVVGPAMIRKLTAYKIGQAVRSDGPQSHLTKAGTPTMGAH